MSQSLSEDIALPQLRQDLALLQGPANIDGEPTWNIFDSVRNRYFKIGWAAFQLLSRWSTGTASKLIAKVNAETTCHVTNKDIDDLLVFLHSNSLTISTPGENYQDYLDQYNSSKQNWLIWLVKNYLFFRIPLVKPHAFLKKTSPYIEILFSPITRNIVILLGVLGLFLVSRQWDIFVTSFLYFFSVQGIAAYIAGLIFIKILHELGHAYTATRYGVKVSTMGIAFLIMFPVLYTDTSNAWRLTSKTQRLHIGFAGMIVELYIACLATFAWVLLPEGIGKSIAFILATSSWILSLSINLNIFMRFDGYYILSDWWGVENLQKKSFALGKWKLSELLFGLNQPPPERVSSHMRNKLILYAWGTWVYRFFLFIAIALLVYHLFFKLLGIILFVIEIIYFIIMPIIGQIKVWWQHRKDITRSTRTYFTFSAFFLLLVLLFVPWSTSVKVPAILEATESVNIYSPIPANVKSLLVEERQHVSKDELIAKLESKQLNTELVKANNKINHIQLLLKRHASSSDYLSNLHVLLSRLEEARSEYASLQEQITLLDIYSPVDGVVVDINDSVHESRWVNESIPLFNIRNQSNHVVGLITENNISRVQFEDHAEFYPDNAQISPMLVKINDIENINVKDIKQAYFNSSYGGDIAVRQDQNGNYVPEVGVYRITFTPQELTTSFDYVLRGQVLIEGEAKSLISRILNLVFKVFVRESGF